MDSQITDANPRHVLDLRAKQTLFYMYALQCHAFGDLSTADVEAMCKLNVKIHHGRLFEDPTASDVEMASLSVACERIMSDRIVDILSGVDDSALTRIVSEVLGCTPTRLHWEPHRPTEERTACKGAWGRKDGQDLLFSINIMTGAVLLNGLPPSRLSHDILCHPLFKRTFEDRDFEICSDGSTLTTTRKVSGCFYSFEMRTCGADGKDDGNIVTELVIHEIDASTRTKLRLLNGTCTDEWGSKLPRRLQELYSHWYSDAEGVLVLRPVLFRHKEVHYILKTDFVLVSLDPTQVEFNCYCVPNHLRAQVWQTSLAAAADFDQLVLLTDSPEIPRVLEKFECREFIHVHVTPAPRKCLKFVLPRFQLEFELTASSMRSLDHANYQLALSQQLGDTLIGFRQYLVMEPVPETSADVMIIVPVGRVHHLSADHVEVEVDSGSGAVCDTHVYKIHPRFRYLSATSGVARLQLAALYAATGSLLPDRRLGMTGDEYAMELVRQSTVNHPLSMEAVEQLESVATLSGRTPGLVLLCQELEQSSNRLHFLYESAAPLVSVIPRELKKEAKTRYLNAKQPYNSRAALTKTEESRLMACSRPDKPKGHLSQFGALTRDVEVRFKGFVEITEKELKSLLTVIEPLAESHSTKYPLSTRTNNVQSKSSPLWSKMHEDWKESWDAYQELSTAELNVSNHLLLRKLNATKREVETTREQLQVYLLQCIREIPHCDHVTASGYGRAFEMHMAASVVPTVQVTDFLRIALNPGLLEKLNPFLSAETNLAVHENVLIWHELCVLEDRMARLLRVCDCASNSEAGTGVNQEVLKRELGVLRTWGTEDHPYWIVFEVIHQLQIRPVQYDIAKTLIDGLECNESGPFAQLNMGEGKTRVILPMLVLHWMNKNPALLVRLNFLDSLIDEAFEYLHQYLCANALQCKLFRLPFHRNIELTSERLKFMELSLSECQGSGALITAPEHRASFYLKGHEIRIAEESVLLDCWNRVAQIECIDMLDECDQILWFRRQVIYACGSHRSLPEGSSRWTTVQALLSAMKEKRILESKDLLAGARIADLQPNRGAEGDEGFPKIRLIPGEDFDKIEGRLLDNLVDSM
jgi:hypothetical protein